MKRLAVYVFWEKDGIMRDYVKYFLLGLKRVAEDVVVVANGGMKEVYIDELRKYSIRVLQRENVGVDFWAYKHGMDNTKDYEKKYDEVVLANCSCYGPIYPFEEMFEEMGKKDVDFWGITEWPMNQSGYEGTWVLSYFMVFRKRMINSIEWKEYWKNLCPVYSRDECIDLHETKFTSYFSTKGFSYDVYCQNTPDYIDMTIEAPYYMVKELRCPVIKRKAFCAEYNRFLSFHRGNESRNVFSYIKEQGLYDTNMILDDMLATQHYDSVKNCLHLNYILDENRTQECDGKNPKVIICFHVYYEELLERSIQYLKSAPDYADIFITTPKEELILQIEKYCREYEIKNYKIECISARGRAEAAFLVATKDFIMDYDYACIVHDKKSSFLQPGIIGKEFGWHNQDALLKSKAYVQNIINLFERNERLGMLIPFNLLYANYRELYGSEWGNNYEGTVKFLKKNGVTVPVSKDVPPVCPMGAMFWIRPKSMNGLIGKSWEYEDFPEEPLPLDGSLIHIIERAYPFFVQQEGFLTGWVEPVSDAEVYVTDIAFLYRNCKLDVSNQRSELALKDAQLEMNRKEIENQSNEIQSLKNRICAFESGDLTKGQVLLYIKRKIARLFHVKK